MRRWFPLALLAAACAHGAIQASDACRSHCDDVARSGACRQAYPDELAARHPMYGAQGCNNNYDSDPVLRACNQSYPSCVNTCEKARTTP